MPPVKMPGFHKSMYDCLHTGYVESKKKLEGIGKTDVNQYQMYLKFICKDETSKGDPV